MRLTLGFSPCPNDTFIFDAMVHGRIDTEGIEFDYFLADVEELNRRAMTAEADITKISFHVYAYVAGNYLILDSGSALGHRNGPLLISKHPIRPHDLKEKKIAIPGKFTTANLLFSIAWPEAINKKEYLFSDIEKVLLEEEADAGIIIHETRFTYEKKGLVKIADLGEYWENLTGMPIPLGAIIIKRDIPGDIALKVNRILKRSLEFAMKDKSASSDFVSANAREMDSAIVNKHIQLYVNEYSLSLGTGGREAINGLFRIANEKGVIPPLPQRIFLIQ
ncbi:MAG: 1,4-dihydroxy-6-naphthoate synthase [Bacteroidetes bacterium GWE2_41_25]|nr:MAG: 1,4-dihydroxy-6-naphthoate synthase [Bacteroidetes bacterium GWA2_40_15]OFX98292.1 MAG: 1,4-dihydroxy-6-naphthoate synthase [Bacteroidetes bacterium GWC2_40_22]OFY11418.1 MAG: 1,4-dihydroxy-6-naphthoate synthase [Bacteroidetes bacterium GWE2_41_25]OFY61819.1 MAG: 1,4-dihydroxy-6-naphthoate synthase [Bacteroidetes bacterium GWF2_41_9]HAM09296.1 1,4-dihydroxy-6-naphthoate synthase [Bacteroidales bacterium]